MARCSSTPTSTYTGNPDEIIREAREKWGLFTISGMSSSLPLPRAMPTKLFPFLENTFKAPSPSSTLGA
ncbi:MAG: hypothetical protein ACE5GD_10585 [Candidatus Geothermarchaeales archaeon]